MDNFIILMFIIFIFLFVMSRKKKKIKQTLDEKFKESIKKLANAPTPVSQVLTDAELKKIIDFWDEMDISTYTSNISDATTVLIKLGYKNKEIKKTLSTINTELLTTENIVKQALLILNK